MSANSSPIMNSRIVKLTRQQRNSKSNYCKIDHTLSPVPILSKTARLREQLARTGITNFYAGPSFTDSPMAHKVPLPPMKWLEEADSGIESETMSSNDSPWSTRPGSVASVVSTSSNFLDCHVQALQYYPATEGIRLTPQQLIAAVAS